MNKNSEENRENCKIWYTNNKKRKKEYNLKRLYGITIDEYNDIFTFQNGKCIGCNRHQEELKRALCVDHCHTTGKVRGLLCHSCNSLVGFINNDIKILKNLINYINFE